MKMILILLGAFLAASAAAEDCSRNSECDRECINNTMDEFDDDCSVPEEELYTKSTGKPELYNEEVQEMIVLPARERLCPQIKEGVCDTACEGVDLDCLCGDFECQPHESAATCPADCRYEENAFCAIVRDGHCDANCLPFDADCMTKTIAMTTKTVQARFDLPVRTIHTTLALLLLVLCAVAIYLMHKAFMIKKGQGLNR